MNKIDIQNLLELLMVAQFCENTRGILHFKRTIVACEL